MRSIFLIIGVLFIAFGASSQNYEIEYEYDPAGNRIERKIVEVILKRENKQKEPSKPIYDKWDEQKVTIFPNPTKGELNISIQAGDFDAQYNYTLINSSGAVLKKDLINNISYHQISLEEFPKGIYFLIINSTAGKKKTYKVVKQ